MLVWGITVFELAAGSMLMIGYRARVAALGFIAMLLAGIVLIHRHLGWFVGEHGTGGSEYSVALILALLVIAAADDGGAWRNDRGGVAPAT
jgi:putative oxidoreductase